MRRDHFTVAARNVDGESPDGPTLDIEYDGPEETFTAQLTDSSGDQYPAAELDAAFRLQAPLENDDVTGVFSLTHRVTGDYLLEVNAPAETVLDLVRTARECDGDDASYHVHIDRADGGAVDYEIDALLVYDDAGDLLRQHSLIPSGVEL